MKTCTKCREEKEETEFRWRWKDRGIRSCWCKSCYSEYERKKWNSSPERRKSNTDNGKIRRIELAKFIYKYLEEHPCLCGESNPAALDFDHRDSSTKTETISYLSRSGCKQKLLIEMGKCDVLCSNCHRKRTAKQLGWYKFLKTEDSR